MEHELKQLVKELYKAKRHGDATDVERAVDALTRYYYDNPNYFD